jgi:hypothetical protein
VHLEALINELGGAWSLPFPHLGRADPIQHLPKRSLCIGSRDETDALSPLRAPAVEPVAIRLQRLPVGASRLQRARSLIKATSQLDGVQDEGSVAYASGG